MRLHSHLRGETNPHQRNNKNKLEELNKFPKKTRSLPATKSNLMVELMVVIKNRCNRSKTTKTLINTVAVESWGLKTTSTLVWLQSKFMLHQEEPATSTFSEDLIILVPITSTSVRKKEQDPLLTKTNPLASCLSLRLHHQSKTTATSQLRAMTMSISRKTARCSKDNMISLQVMTKFSVARLALAATLALTPASPAPNSTPHQAARATSSSSDCVIIT